MKLKLGKGNEKMKKNNKKGFTLAELLIVVAIIAVLVAISIPIFNAQLRKARLATNQANARAAYAEVVAETLTKGYAGGTGTYDVAKAKLTGSVAAQTATVSADSKAIASWSVGTDKGSGALGDTTYTTWTVTVDPNGNVKITGSAS